MRVLALDTTTREGSVALVQDDRVVEERAGDPRRTHAERLPLEIHALLDHHGLRTADVDLFAVASGPGSFTGLRIGIATLQGLAFVQRRKIAAVSALEALAHLAGGREGEAVGAWMDAHRGDVFSALYRISSAPAFDSGHVIEEEAPAVGDPASTVQRWARLVDPESVIFIGDGARLWGEIIQSAFAQAPIVAHPLLAGAIGRLATARASAAVDPAAVRPLYVRRPDAEIERDRKAMTHSPAGSKS